jgi:hypothetical protein
MNSFLHPLDIELDAMIEQKNGEFEKIVHFARYADDTEIYKDYSRANITVLSVKDGNLHLVFSTRLSCSIGWKNQSQFTR